MTDPFIRRAQFKDALGQLKTSDTITLPKREEYYAPAFVDLFSNMDANFIQMSYGKHEEEMLGKFARMAGVPVSDVKTAFEGIHTSTTSTTTKAPHDELFKTIKGPLKKKKKHGGNPR